MPDISMCKGGDCPKKQKCYRFRAVPSEHRQSYFAEVPFQPDGTCAYFAPLLSGDLLEKK
jgi:hypothetical protein